MRRGTSKRHPRPPGFAYFVVPILCLVSSGRALAQSPLPDSFHPQVNEVYALAVQTDGRIAIGGDSYLARLNCDGTQTPGFNPQPEGGYPYNTASVRSLAIQADGRILAGGYFTTLGGQPRHHIARLNVDGTLDAGFNPGADGGVWSLALQADGKIVAQGDFTAMGGQPRAGMARLNPDGTLDPEFNPGRGGGIMGSLAVQADGKILIGGLFSSGLFRLNADGTLDERFNPGAAGGYSSAPVFALAVQADGKILVGGGFSTLGGQPRTHIGRLNADGTLDEGFNPGTDSGMLSPVYSLALQANGNILLAGRFATVYGQPRDGIARLNANGSLDSGFNPDLDFGEDSTQVSSLAIQADGKILVAGDFIGVAGQPRSGIARLNNTEPATQSVTFDGSTLIWTRGGTSPEVWRTTFEYSPDGASWTNLGAGIRINGGWQLNGLALPTNSTFRARGYTVAGGSSSWFVETVLRPALVISGIVYSANGPFRFSAGGPAGHGVVVESSPDLRIWTPLQTNTLGADPLSLSDPQTGVTSRFYRLRSGP